MEEFQIEPVDSSPEGYRIHITTADTDLSFQCDIEQLEMLQTCIERTLAETTLTSCRLNDETGFALSPWIDSNEGTHKLVINVAGEIASLPLDQQQLEFFAHSEIDAMCE
jgi:hypothetical protein